MSGPYEPFPEIELPPAGVGSLLAAARSFPAGVDWRSGVSVPARAWRDFVEPFCAGDWLTVVGGESGTTEVFPWPEASQGEDYPDCDEIRFDPFGIVEPAVVESASAAQVQRMVARTQRVLDERFAAAVARALWAPATYDDGFEYLPPFIQSPGVNPTLGAAVSLTDAGPPWTPADTPVAPTAALAALLARWAQISPTGGAHIHMSPALLVDLAAHGLVAQVGQRLVGPLDSTLIADPGYGWLGAGSQPRDVAGNGLGIDTLATDATFTGWMILTGPIYVAYGEPELVRGSELEDARWNRTGLFVRRRACFAYDSTRTAGVLAFSPRPATTEV